jgi:hypothetical protein
MVQKPVSSPGSRPVLLDQPLHDVLTSDHHVHQYEQNDYGDNAVNECVGHEILGGTKRREIIGEHGFRLPEYRLQEPTVEVTSSVHENGLREGYGQKCQH